jgi:hypothetical protein
VVGSKGGAAGHAAAELSHPEEREQDQGHDDGQQQRAGTSEPVLEEEEHDASLPGVTDPQPGCRDEAAGSEICDRGAMTTDDQGPVADHDSDLEHMATILQELAALVAAATGDERAAAIEQQAAALREQIRAE